MKLTRCRWCRTGALIAGLVVVLATSAVQARQSTDADRLVFTFSGPVAVPGATLPAGKYQFQEMNTTGSHAVVEITNEHGTGPGCLRQRLPCRSGGSTQRAM